MGAPSPHHWTLPALSCDGAFVSIYPRSPRKQALHSEIRGQGSLDITALEQRGELTDHKWKPEVRGSRGPGCSGWGSPRGQFEGGGLAPQAWPRWLSRGHWHPRGGWVRRMPPPEAGLCLGAGGRGDGRLLSGRLVRSPWSPACPRTCACELPGVSLLFMCPFSLRGPVYPSCLSPPPLPVTSGPRPCPVPLTHLGSLPHLGPACAQGTAPG